MPHLIRRVHAEGYGKIQFAYTTLLLLGFLVDFSHNITAPREIALNGSSHSELSNIVNRIFSTRLFLAFMMVPVIGLLLLIPRFQCEWTMFLTGFSIIFGFAIQCNWFFQGKEDMSYIAYANIVGKGTTLTLIFTLVTRPEHYTSVPLFWGIGSILTGIFLYIIMATKYKIVPVFKLNLIWKELQVGTDIFLANVSTIIYMNIGTVILGFFLEDKALGFYSIGERIVMASRQVLSVFSQVIYPQICKLTLLGFEQTIVYIKKLFFPFLILVCLGCMLLFAFSDTLVFILAQEKLPKASMYLKEMSFIPLIVCLNIPAYQLLLAYNIKAGYTYLMMAGSILFIIITSILANLLKAEGAIWSIYLTESFITVGLWVNFNIYKKKINDKGL